MKHIKLAAVAAALIIWTGWQNNTVGITHYTVLSDSLPAAFDQYKIAVVSDLHNGEYGENNCRLTSIIKKESPDMIAVTGDFVDSKRTDMKIAEELIKRLTEIAPCYYVTGNHEAWIGGRYQELEEKLLDTGVIILHDRSVGLMKDNVANNAENICKLTHFDPRCVGSCVIVSSIIHALVFEDRILDYEDVIGIAKQYDERIVPFVDLAYHEGLNSLCLDDEKSMGYLSSG